MHDHIEYLIDLLEKETATFRLLLASLEAEQKALVENDTQGLEEAVETQKALTQRAATQEHDRVNIVRQIAALMDEDPQSLSVVRLIDLLDDPFSERLRTLRETLLDLQGDLRLINRQNSLLLKQSMKYVDKTLEALTGASATGNLYERTGKADAPASSMQGVVNQVV